MSVFEGFVSIDDVFSEFNAPEEDQEGVEIIYAVYERGDYEGSAFVLFRKGGKLFEVNGSHCSCNGLEECWGPEETSIEALRKREYYMIDIKAVEKALEEHMLTL